MLKINENINNSILIYLNLLAAHRMIITLIMQQDFVSVYLQILAPMRKIRRKNSSSNYCMPSFLSFSHFDSWSFEVFVSESL